MLNHNKSIYLLLIIILTASVANAQIISEVTLTRNGIDLKSKIFMADGAGPFPTVILLHGFPGNENDVLGLGEKLASLV